MHSGGYAENRRLGPAGMVELATTKQKFLKKYPFPDVVGIFGWGYDDRQTTTDIFIRAARQKSDSTRRVIVSNEIDFFKDYEANAPPNVTPIYSASFGNDWEGNFAVMAEVTASVKRAVEALRTAEALSVFASLVDPEFMTPFEADRDSAFNNIGLYFEHDAITDGPYDHKRRRFNRGKATQINNYVNSLQEKATALLGNSIPCPDGKLRMCVFNPLSWTRTDFADIPLKGNGTYRVKNISLGEEVPAQIIQEEGNTVLRILARDVPPMGYQVYEVESGLSQTIVDSVKVSEDGQIMENHHYRVTMGSHGSITSLIDKQDDDREWVQEIDGLTMNDQGTGSGQPLVKHTGPVSACILIDAGGQPAHRTEITLYSEIDRIDIKNEIYENFWGNPPVYYGFGLQLGTFMVRHEEVGAIATARLTSDGGHYATASAKYDYLTMNHFVDVSGPDRGITLSNWDSPFFRLGNSTVWHLDTSIPLIRAIVGGQLAPQTRVFGGQDGDSYFLNRYALQCHGAYDGAESMRMALEHQNPLHTFW